MENMKILQIVGFKNSGKTTLMNRFIESAQKAGKKVSAIKHHGHGGPPELPDHGTDSMKFLGSGAASSLVFGDGVVQMHMQGQKKELSSFIKLSLLTDPDFILIEGFKQAPYPKIVLVRSPEEWLQLKGLDHISLVIVPHPMVLDGVRPILRDDSSSIDSFFTVWMEGDFHESV